MRVLASLGIAASLASCHVASTPPATATPALATRKTSPLPARLPRYFPRAPGPLTVVGETDGGTAALHGSMRLLLRGGQDLPDSASYLVTSSTGGMETGGTPTGSAASNATAVPERLGGGWLFVVGRELWHAPSWLAAPKRLFEFMSPPHVHLGLDAPVVQETGRAPFAFQVADGQRIALSHWPDAPAIADVAARDARHAAVVADLRGLSITEDGGNSWREITSNRTPIGVRAAPGGYLVRGRNGTDDHDVSWHIDIHGETRSEDVAPGDDKPERRPLSSAAWERIVEHGLDDAESDRYVVLDHGVLERWRQSDGAWLERKVVTDARDTCRPVHWPAGTATEAGFACTGPDGTSIWRASPNLTRLWKLPGRRRVWSSEIGALAIEGACEDAGATAGMTTLCVWGRGATPSTVRLQGAKPDDLLVPLRDGSLVVLRPPSGPANARRGAEMFVDTPPNGAAGSQAGRVQGIPLHAGGALKADVAAHLAQGHWLGDPEAIDGGGFAVWLEHEGRLLGVHVARDGRIEPGPRSAVASMHRVAGLRALSWSNAGAGFESVDGGLHYTQIGLPSAEPPNASDRTPRADAKAGPIGAIGCTAIGCILPSLVRVGWGANLAAAKEPDKAKTSPTSLPQSAGRIALECSLVWRGAADAPTRSRVPVVSHVSPRPYGGYGNVAATSFYGTQPPKVRADQVLQGWDAVDLADRRTSTLLGRVFLWGTYALGADPDAGWQWRWFDPRTHSVHASAIAKSPDALSVAHQMQTSMINRSAWSSTVASDPRHAIGFAQDGARTLVFSLVDGEAPAPIELAEGGDFGTLDAGIAAPGDRAILAGPVGDPAGTAIYLARGPRAERIARVPRVGVQGKPGPALVALHSDGVRIAIAVEDRDVAARTEAAFYLREAYPSDGPVRRFALETRDGSRTLRVCNDTAQGFEGWAKLDLNGDVTLTGTSRSARLTSPTRAKLRFLDDGGLCLLEVATGIDAEGAAALSTARLSTATASSMPMLVEHGGRHYTLACGSR